MEFVRSVRLNFMEKFKDKTNFITKEGLNCILFKETP